jgi:hypothetical protein
MLCAAVLALGIPESENAIDDHNHARIGISPSIQQDLSDWVR